MINNIRESAGKFFLKRKMLPTKRKGGTFNLQHAKTIGILFDSSKIENWELVKKYVSTLKERHKKVKAIGYFSAKHIPKFTYSKLDFEFFTTKEVNWYLKPSNNLLKDFADKEYDILIDLDIHDQFPLKYIAGITNAKLKVGKYKEENKDIYDLMIKADETKNLDYFIQQTDIYLNMINK